MENTPIRANPILLGLCIFNIYPFRRFDPSSSNGFKSSKWWILHLRGIFQRGTLISGGTYSSIEYLQSLKIGIQSAFNGLKVDSSERKQKKEKKKKKDCIPVRVNKRKVVDSVFQTHKHNLTMSALTEIYRFKFVHLLPIFGL